MHTCSVDTDFAYTDSDFALLSSCTTATHRNHFTSTALIYATQIVSRTLLVHNDRKWP